MNGPCGSILKRPLAKSANASQARCDNIGIHVQNEEPGIRGARIVEAGLLRSSPPNQVRPRNEINVPAPPDAARRKQENAGA